MIKFRKITLYFENVLYISFFYQKNGAISCKIGVKPLLLQRFQKSF